jgi:dTDP-4-dehydrorhamnose reductase
MVNIPKIVITGANGQVGKCLFSISKNYPDYEFHFLGREHLPIDNHQLTQQVLNTLNPRFIINTAAYTEVDKAESEIETANNINGYAVGNLAKTAREIGSEFLHISTDYVFNGKATKPYIEDDETDPVNAYGASKLLGEVLSLKENPESIILRTSWVYSIYGSNFVKTMRRLMQERQAIGVVNDQWGAPTYAMDLAEAILSIVCKSKWQNGIYHFANKGEISWFEFASLIREIGNYDCTVNLISTDQFPTPANRPRYSVLDCYKIENSFNLKIKDWKSGLKNAMVSFKD